MTHTGPDFPCRSEDKEDAMQSLKEEAIKVISSMPEPVDIDDIMYRLYVIDKIRKGREAAQRGETLSVEDLKKELQQW